MKGMLNKGIASVLSAALIMGLTPAIPDMSIKSYADEAIDTTPSVQAYADKATLMGSTFAPGADGTNKNVGLLYFGTNGTDPQKWYILGKDDQVKDEKGNDTDNIAIFAASDILSSQCFNANSSSYHEYNVSEGNKNDISYVKGKPDTNNKVAPNHYGGSDIRSALRKMSGEEEDTTAEKKYNKYFTDTEKKMMQKTTVLTQDYDTVTDSTGNTYNKLYTTSDKLYLASGEYSTDKIIYVGGVSKSEGYDAADEYTSIKLSWENYWNSKTQYFWLRSPVSSLDSFALSAFPGNGGSIGFIWVNYRYGVRPASNLDLSSVLFASAADAAPTESDEENGGKITTSGTDQDAMILRLDGSNKNIGTFTYNEHGITVTKGTTGSTTG